MLLRLLDTGISRFQWLQIAMITSLECASIASSLSNDSPFSTCSDHPIRLRSRLSSSTIRHPINRRRQQAWTNGMTALSHGSQSCMSVSGDVRQAMLDEVGICTASMRRKFCAHPYTCPLDRRPACTHLSSVAQSIPAHLVQTCRSL